MSEGEQQRQQENGEQQRNDGPRVWIASLSDYNDGHLHGAWVNADQEPEGIWSGINEVLATSPTPGAEEWAIFDHMGFGPMVIDEFERVERISQLGLGIAEHGEPFAVFAHFLGEGDGKELLEQFEDCYMGEWESTTAYVEEYLDSIGIETILDNAVPVSLREYVRVDVEAIIRDMDAEGSLLAIDAPEGSVYLFHPP
jgi:antirestriction protein